jgi:peptide/nickel transport system substrate-binding protein
MTRRLSGALIVAAVSALAIPAQAQELKIAIAAEPTSIDPLHHTLNPNNQVARHIFDRLVHQDTQQRLVPGLALSWKPVDEATWEFKLRPGVAFHDGAPLTPDDIIFSIDRADKVPNSPASFAIYTKSVKAIEVIEPSTLRVKTGSPYPLLPNDLSTISIQEKRAVEGKGTEDFNRGTGSWNGSPAIASCSSATRHIGVRSPTGRGSPCGRSPTTPRAWRLCSRATSTSSRTCRPRT